MNFFNFRKLITPESSLPQNTPLHGCNVIKLFTVAIMPLKPSVTNVYVTSGVRGSVLLVSTGNKDNLTSTCVSIYDIPKGEHQNIATGL